MSDYNVEFDPPVMPFDYTEKEARAISRYLDFFDRKKEALDFYQQVPKNYFDKASAEEKDAILTEIAKAAQKLISEKCMHWSAARCDAILKYEDMHGYDEYGNSVIEDEYTCPVCHGSHVHCSGSGDTSDLNEEVLYMYCLDCEATWDAIRVPVFDRVENVKPKD